VSDDRERHATERPPADRTSAPNGPDLQGRISAAYRITGVPETFIVDREGYIVLTKVGPFMPGELDAVIRDLLSQTE